MKAWTGMARTLAGTAFMGVVMLTGGCAATSVLTFAYEQANGGECISPGCAAGAMLSYALDKATEGDPTPCRRLNTVERALSGRCGAYEPGSLLTKDVTASGLPRCPLALAARDATLWPVLPELIEKGGAPERCAESPLVALAQASPCPDFGAASAESLAALRWLAVVDARAVHHDVVRMLSCPAARSAGLDSVLDSWVAQGQLPTRGLAFGPLGALHPTALNSPLSRAMEAQGHTARAALGAYAGRLPGGFDAALRAGDIEALDWWLDRAPELANRVPPHQGNQLAWLPLARVITPSYLMHPDQQVRMVAYLISRGADPWRALPHDPSRSVVNLARTLKSPSLALLDPPMLAAGGRLQAAAAVSGTVGSVLSLP
jgi:hypothetical protein